MTTKKSASAKKEKLFHPSSRKAGQLARKAIRQTKLSNILHERHTKHNASGTSQVRLCNFWSVHLLLLVDLYGFFYNAIPEDGVLTLGELHQLVRDIWLTRFDAELESHRSARRSGRPKSTKEMKLEELMLREAETYRTGMGTYLIIWLSSVFLNLDFDRGNRPHTSTNSGVIPKMGSKRSCLHPITAIHKNFYLGP
jgi:translation machinery-associated protein 16